MNNDLILYCPYCGTPHTLAIWAQMGPGIPSTTTAAPAMLARLLQLGWSTSSTFAIAAVGDRTVPQVWVRTLVLPGQFFQKSEKLWLLPDNLSIPRFLGVLEPLLKDPRDIGPLRNTKSNIKDKLHRILERLHELPCHSTDAQILQWRCRTRRD